MSTPQLIEGVYSGRAADVAERLLRGESDNETGPHDVDTLPKILAACADIAEQLTIEQDEVLARLHAVGIPVTALPVTEAPQRHTFSLRVDDPSTAERVADELATIGFDRWERWEGGARKSFHRNADHLTVARTADATLMVRVIWADATPRSTPARLLRPTSGDWQMVPLPDRAWRAYPLVRLVRLLAERTGLRRRHASGLGPFLATPDALLVPLLESAQPTPGELVIDLGCGDGRLPVTAATTFGCRAVGVEVSPALADRARDRVARAGVTDRVSIITGDARSAELGDADVIFAFLPTDVLADLLPGILSRMRTGARLITHEQNRLPAGIDPPPDESRVVVGDAALTVAHRWTV